LTIFTGYFILNLEFDGFNPFVFIFIVINFKGKSMIVIEDINHIGLTVSNLEKSVDFYKELFDFEKINKLSTENQAVLKVGDIYITLYEVEKFSVADDSQNRISFYVDEGDFDDTVDEIEDAGIGIVYGPENIRGGQLMVFADPDGNLIELSYPKLV